jgi:hypothetical protein
MWGSEFCLWEKLSSQSRYVFGLCSMHNYFGKLIAANWRWIIVWGGDEATLKQITCLQEFISSRRERRTKFGDVRNLLLINPDTNVSNYWSWIIISKVQHYKLLARTTCRAFAAIINKQFSKQNKVSLIWSGGLASNVQDKVTLRPTISRSVSPGFKPQLGLMTGH